MTTTAHPIDTSAASQWALVGLPYGVRRWRDTGEVSIFVQRSWIRGRPWLRFSSRFEGEGWYVTAHPTRRAALCA